MGPVKPPPDSSEVLFLKVAMPLKFLRIQFSKACQFLIERSSRIRKMGAMQFLQLVTYGIAIVGFLTAIEYFSAKSSLHVSIPEMSFGLFARYNFEGVSQFYDSNNIAIPEPLAAFLEKNAKSRDKGISGPVLSESTDSEIISAINDGYRDSDYIALRTKFLEEQIGKYDFKKHVYVYTDFDGFFTEETIKDLLPSFKDALSVEEHFIFLAAIIFSRQIDNRIYFKNDGDLNLERLEIRISPPFSKITENRGNNILQVYPESQVPHTVLANADGLTIYLPQLLRDEGFLLSVITRENKIDRRDISYSFAHTRALDKRRLLITSLVVFVVLVIIAAVWKGNAAQGQN